MRKRAGLAIVPLVQHTQIFSLFGRENFSVQNKNNNIVCPFFQKIQQHNAEGHSYTLAMNQFGDLTVDEYRFFFLGLRGHYSNETKREGSTFLPPSGVTLPPTVDWRTKGYVTPIKNQGMFFSKNIETQDKSINVPQGRSHLNDSILRGWFHPQTVI